MKNAVFHLFAILLSAGGAPAAPLVHEDFDYPAGGLSGRDGGTGWSGPWFDSGTAVSAVSSGLGYTDPVGHTLVTSGGAADTGNGDALTTISGRETGARNGELWISMVVEPRNDSSLFFGASFYDGSLDLADARFAIEHAGNKNLRLTRRAGQLLHTPSFATSVGTPVFAVLHLVPGGGEGGALPDRIDVHFNPRLDQEPSTPHASVDIDGLQFDRIRIAGQNGRSTLVDEVRIGSTYADVAPYTPAEDPDSDTDGLTDAQEAILGTDPLVPDTALVAAIRANPGWFGLHSEDEVATVNIGRVELQAVAPTTFDFEFDIIPGDGAEPETLRRSLEVGPVRKFIRLGLAAP